MFRNAKISVKSSSRFRSFCWILGIAFVMGVATAAAQQNSPNTVEQRCIVVELYTSSKSPSSAYALEEITRYEQSRGGIKVAVRSVDNSEAAQERLARIATHFRIDPTATPLVYAVNQVIRNGVSTDDFYNQISNALTMEVYTRNGCSRCESAKRYLPVLAARYPGLRIVYREITTSPENQNRLNALVARHHKSAVSTPVFHVCDQLTVGFDRPETSGVSLQQTVDRWTVACPKAVATSSVTGTPNASAREVAARSPF